MTDLEQFEGRDVLGVAIIVRKAGDGLSSALDMEPIELQLGDHAGVLIQGKVTAINFVEVKGVENAYRRVHVITTEAAQVFDADQTAELMEDHLNRLAEHKAAKEKAKEEAAGIYQLGDEADDEADAGDYDAEGYDDEDEQE